MRDINADETTTAFPSASNSSNVSIKPFSLTREGQVLNNFATQKQAVFLT